MSEKFYQSKVAVVTGASSGIGRELAVGLAERGAEVLAVARREQRLNDLREETRYLAGNVHPLVGDISVEGVGDEVRDKADRMGGVDILVNNAAFGFNAPTVDVGAEKVAEIIGTNLLGTINFTKGLLGEMISRQRGQIVFVTSLAGKMGFPGLSVYSASKFGVEGFAEALRTELVGQGVDVTVFRPGVTDTEFFEVAGMEDFARDMSKGDKMASSREVSEYLLKHLPEGPKELTFGRDAIFLRLLPFIPHSLRLRVLSLIG